MRDLDQAVWPRPAGSVRWALRIAGASCVAALVATHLLARLSQPVDGVRVTIARAPGRVADPETTGSIASGARSTRLDPCAVGGPRRP